MIMKLRPRYPIKAHLLISFSSLLSIALMGCSHSDSYSTSSQGSLQLSLSRDQTHSPNPIIGQIKILDSSGAVVLFAPPPVITTDVPTTIGTPIANADGSFTFNITPSVTASQSQVIELTANSINYGATLTREVLVLPSLNSFWGQPEGVPGLVNTLGTEDSAEVSPDGNWLIVSSYTPIDLFCCELSTVFPGCPSLGAASPALAACNSSLGPYSAPARPNLFGADRILSPTSILETISQMGKTTPIVGYPVSAYGFKLQSDGTFGAPFVIGYEMDGYPAAPFGLTFLQTPDAHAQTQFLFAWSNPLQSQGNQIFWTPATLGSEVILGTFTYSSSILSASNMIPEQITTSAANPPVQHGNPNYSGGFLWMDDESIQTPNNKFIWFAPVTGTFPAVTLGSFQKAGFESLIGSAPGFVSGNEIQPFYDASQGRIYFTENSASIVSGAFSTSSNAASAGSYTSARVDIATDADISRVGAVISIGETSIAHTANGSTYLYFVYYKKTATGYDGNVGRVKAQ